MKEGIEIFLYIFEIIENNFILNSWDIYRYEERNISILTLLIFSQ